MGYKSEVFGTMCIARLLNKSFNVSGDCIETFEIEYPRIIHSELMTHKMLSKNAASSRAIPIAKTIEAVRNSPAMPVHWGKNQAGMQASVEVTNPSEAEWYWIQAAKSAADRAEILDSLGLHKQVVNRILEPYVFMKTVITGTEWDNFYYLRDHADADPTIAELARVMKKASEAYEGQVLMAGEWHFAYVDTDVGFGSATYHIDGEMLDLETAKKVDAACCAQVSFRKLDTSIEKALSIYERLAGAEPIHASPFEHAATPMKESGSESHSEPVVNMAYLPDTWEEGITHMDKNGALWSANLKGFIQHRKLIAGNYKEG